MTVERDRLKSELDGVLQALSDDKAETGQGMHKRDVQIVELTVQVVKLKQELEEARENSAQINPVRQAIRKPKTAAGERSRVDDGEDCVEVNFQR